MANKTEVRAPAEMGEPDVSLLRALWRTLQSIRTAIYLLIIIAAATTIGAVIPQGRPPEYYAMAYGDRWGRLVTGLGFDHLYGSTWFVITIALLLLNLAACVRQSWRRASARYRGPGPKALSRKFTGPQAPACWQGRGESAGSADDLAQILRRRGYAIASEDGPRRRKWLVARRWSLAAYGGIVTHIAIFLVALGAVLGCLPWTSLNDQITLAEGETLGATDREVALPFEVRLDDFRMEYYAETGTPSSYESDITLLTDGAEVLKGTSTVNSQVSHKGMALGQSSWGIAGIRLTVQSDDGPQDPVVFSVGDAPGPHGEQQWALGRDRVALLEPGTLALVAENFVADAFEQDGEIVGSLGHYPRNPAVQLSGVSGLDSGEHEFHDLGWLRLGGETQYEDYGIRFDDIVYTSTLSVRKDPGLPFVWLGFILVSVGMIVTFYIRPRTFLVELDPVEPETTLIRVAPAGRQLLEADRRAIEAATGAELTPMARAKSRPARAQD